MGKVLLIIGASSDMGIELMQKSNQDYELIIAHYHHMNTKLFSLSEQLGERMVCIEADLSDEVQVKKMISEVKSLNRTISHIVHFAAPPCNNQKFHKISGDIFQKELDISLKAAIMILQQFLPKMAKERYGKVVFMLSFVVNGMPPKYCSNYIITKYALLGLLKALAVEYADKGITVNGVSPAWVMTKYIENQPEILIEQNAAQSPIGRNLVASDIIPTIRFLLSNNSDCINGQNISITCGR